MFSDNLDFIMNLTGTKASDLGRACLLNASYVSRLKNGTRPLPKKPVFLDDMSSYFAKHIQADFQKNALCARLGISSYPADTDAAAKLIKKFLSDTNISVPDITPLLESFTGTQPMTSVPDLKKTSGGNRHQVIRTKEYFYGIEGKREAVLRFFDLIAKEKKPQTLLLSSDEEMSWLYDDPAFARKWAYLFMQILSNGNRVKIIHSIGRDMNEMLEAVTKWIPIYNTGMIEPYYYPRLRDGIFQRTLFLAPKTAAVVSASVNRQSDGMLNQLITDKQAIAALTQEYEQFFSLCRPLMHIITGTRYEELWDIYNTLISPDGNILCMSDMPTLLTMPEQVAAAMQKRAPKSCILKQWQITKAFADVLAGSSCKIHYTEILSAASGESAPPLPCADLLGASGLCYTPEEYQAHLFCSAHFAETHKGYTQLFQKDIPPNICLFVKEDQGVIMTKTNADGSAFAFSEKTLVNSFWSYLSGRIS